jgi:hypothetical protein
MSNYWCQVQMKTRRRSLESISFFYFMMILVRIFSTVFDLALSTATGLPDHTSSGTLKSIAADGDQLVTKHA